MKPKFFSHQSDFRKWLEENHENEKELVVGFYKVDSGKPSLTWSQSVDEALCFGWIDGIRKSVDHESYSIRFTPRRPTSIWSAVNANKMEEMIPKGLVKKAGLLAYEKLKDKSKVYTYEKTDPNIKFSTENEIQFKANSKAWEFFQKQPPYYRKQMIKWVISAKQATTQLSRLEKLIKASEDSKRL